MKQIKKHSGSHLFFAVLTIGLLLITTVSFKPAEGEKQIMTIEVIERGRGKGIYVFADGKSLDVIEIPDLGYEKEKVIANGSILNQTLSRYYKDNWKLVGASNGSFAVDGIFTGTRIYLEK